VSEQKRQEIFDDYWGLGNYNLQSSFLNSSVTLNDPMRKKGEPVQKRSVSCT
jgi:hypothetical protein